MRNSTVILKSDNKKKLPKTIAPESKRSNSTVKFEEPINKTDEMMLKTLLVLRTMKKIERNTNCCQTPNETSRQLLGSAQK